jgi:hypothetical protein
MNIAFQLVMGDISIVPTINSIDGETIDGSNFHCKALMGNISIVLSIVLMVLYYLISPSSSFSNFFFLYQCLWLKMSKYNCEEYQITLFIHSAEEQ